jgi:hypothetical protein
MTMFLVAFGAMVVLALDDSRTAAQDTVLTLCQWIVFATASSTVGLLTAGSRR